MEQPRGLSGRGRIIGVLVVLAALGLLAAALGIPAGDDGTPGPTPPAEDTGAGQQSPGDSSPPAAATGTPEPAGTQSPDGGGSTSDPSAGPPPGEPVELGGLVGEVAAVRDLTALGPLDVRRLDDDQMAELVSELNTAELDPTAIERDRRLLVSLRLLEPTDDLQDLLDTLYRSSVVGLYVPEDERLYLTADGPELSPYARFTAAHEVVHALQDQHHDLEQLRDLPEEESDASLAILALVEGDAVVAQQLWSLRHLDAGDRASLTTEALQRAGDAPTDVPTYLRRSLEFPYREGAAFVSALVPAGNLGALGQVYATPPTTTEQILHPEKYRMREEAVAVLLPEQLQAGWEATATYSFGEFDLVELLRPLGDARARSGAAGWGGGMVRLWQRGPAHATSLALAFDSAADGREGCAALGDWYQAVADGEEVEEGVYAGDRDVMAIACAGADVRVGIGGNADTAVAARGSGTG